MRIHVNNELTPATIPPGTISAVAGGRKRQRYFHDFFNYSGLHRSVWLYMTPRAHIADVSVTTDLDLRSEAGRVTYHVDVVGAGPTSVVLRDATGAVVADAKGR